MNRDDVYEMVREAGLDWHAGFADEVNRYEVLAALVRAKVLEEAAQVCDETWEDVRGTALLCAAEIRGMKSDSGHSAAADAGASTAPLPVRSPDSTAFWRDSVYPEGMTAEQVKAELDDFHFLMEQVPKVYMAVSGGLLSKPNYHAATVISAFEDYLTDRVNEEVAEALAGTGADNVSPGSDVKAESASPSVLLIRGEK